MTQQPPSGDEQPRRDSSADLLGADIGTVISSLQHSVEQLRRGAQQEIDRLRTEHEAEMSQLQAELDGLRGQRESQDQQLRSLQAQIQTLLSDYRGDLEGRIQRVDGARQQLYRVQQTLNSLDDLDPDGAPETPLRLVTTDPDDQRRINPQPDSDEGDTPFALRPTAPTAEDTIQIAPTGTMQPVEISISGVSSVTAMLRARAAVEGLPGIHHIESRHAKEGTIYFLVRTGETAETLADSLTSLPDPPLQRRNVADDSIELEMVTVMSAGRQDRGSQFQE